MNLIIILATELMMIIITIYVLCFYNYSIIKNLGIYSLLSLSLGCILKTHSNIFISIDKVNDCYLYLICYFFGFILIYIPFTKKIVISSTFSLKFNYCDRDYILMNNIFSPHLCKNMFFSEKNSSSSLNNNNNNPNKNTFSISNNESEFSTSFPAQSLNFSPIGPNNDFISQEVYPINSSNFSPIISNISQNADALPSSKFSPFSPNNDNNSPNTFPRRSTKDLSNNDLASPSSNKSSKKKRKFMKRIKRKKLHSLHKEFEMIINVVYLQILLLDIIVVIFMISLFIYIYLVLNSSLKDLQMMNGLFSYICPKDQYFLFAYFTEFILILFNILKFKNIFNGKYIYIDSKIINFISAFWIFIDPFLNVIII